MLQIPTSPEDVRDAQREAQRILANPVLRAELQRTLADYHFEESALGILCPRAGIFFGGVFEHDVIRDGRSLGLVHDHNLVVNEGLNHLLSVGIADGTKTSTWYFGLFSGNYTPVAGDTMATFPGDATEFTDYDESNRVEYEETLSGQATDNVNDLAAFTMSDGVDTTIYGGFVSSKLTKSATAGVLLSAVKFTTERPVVAGDQLLLRYTLTASAA